MSSVPTLATEQRWLVLAPHPDDEVLGAGGLLQMLAREHAAVRVVLLTRGENNPWPQRLLERRWLIGEREREHWGKRRLGECRMALHTLGLAPELVLVSLGWPDGEIGNLLMESPEALVTRLAQEFADFAPTHVVLPCADDRHPDHNSAAIAAALALERVQPRPQTLAYLVHGAARVPPGVALALDSEQRQTKLSALRQHATQLALSRGRFEAFVRPQEGFYADVFTDTTRAAPDVRVRATGDALELELEPVRPPLWRLRRPRLELLWEDAAGRLHARVLKLGIRTPHDMEWRRRGHVLSVTLAAPGGVRRLYAKIATGLHGLWIYDQAGWRRARLVA